MMCKVRRTFLVILFSLPAQASLNVGGAVTVSEAVYPESLPGEVNNQLSTIALETDGTWRLNSRNKFKFSLQGRGQPDNRSREERLWFNPREAYYELKAQPMTVQLGMNTFSWGATDGYNPLDVVNPKLFDDPLRSEKIGVPALTVKTSLGVAGTLEALYIPAQTASRLPGIHSRWLPRDIYLPDTDQSYRIILPTEALRYRYTHRVEWAHPFAHNYGARWQAQLGRFDLSLAAFEGAAQTPAIVPSIETNVVQIDPRIELAVNPDIGLEPNFYRQRVTGGTVVVNVADFIIRLTSAYTQPLADSWQLPGWAHETVFGLERGVPLGSWTLTGLFQGSYNRREQGASDSSLSLTTLLDHAVMGGFRLADESAWQFYFLTLVDTRTQAHVTSAEATYALNDFWKLTLQGDQLQGRRDTLIGTYRKNDRAQLSLRRAW